MKVSIITAVLNNAATIKQCISSVHNQGYKNIEHIVIDSGSSDGTLDIIKRNEGNIAKWVSEHDKGMYYALNKGMEMASGDIIGFLHADDYYANDTVIELVVSHMEKYNVDSCYSDLEYIKRGNTGKVFRYWKSSSYTEELLQKGWMPPHPTFFVKKSIYDKYGGFNTDFRIAADYELILRLLGKHKISTYYISDVLVKMRMGGVSNRSLHNIIIKSSEDYKAWKTNNLNGDLFIICRKILSKIPQFFKRKIAENSMLIK